MADVFRQLTRLFKSGPVVRHRIQRLPYQPSDSSGFSSLSYNTYSTVSNVGQIERMARYNDYAEMEMTPELASGLDIYADETCVPDPHGRIIQIKSQDEDIRNILEQLFGDILNLDFQLWGWIRNMCKYGDQMLYLDVSENNGLLQAVPIPINEIEREEGYDPQDPFAYRFRWVTMGNRILQAWQVAHFRVLGNDVFLPYGTSVIEPARRIWRQLLLIEDAMLVYRIIRSPERRVFYIDVGNVEPEKIPAFMERAKTQLKRSQVVDSQTGRVDLRYNPLSVDEDYFVPVRGDKSSRIETLPGGQFTGDIEDVQYIQSKLFAALKIPKSYLGYEEDLGAKSTLAQEDIRFGRTIGRIQRSVISELTRIAIIHLFVLGYTGDALFNFEISMTSPSKIYEMQQLELLRTKMEVAGQAGEQLFDKQWQYDNIFFIDRKQQREIQGRLKTDRMFELEMEAMEAPTAEEPEEPEEPAKDGESIGGKEEQKPKKKEEEGLDFKNAPILEDSELEELSGKEHDKRKTSGPRRQSNKSVAFPEIDRDLFSVDIGGLVNASLGEDADVKSVRKHSTLLEGIRKGMLEQARNRSGYGLEELELDEGDDTYTDESLNNLTVSSLI